MMRILSTGDHRQILTILTLQMRKRGFERVRNLPKCIQLASGPFCRSRLSLCNTFYCLALG